jgi:hypothetical protein
MTQAFPTLDTTAIAALEGAARVHHLLAVIRRLAVDQPVLERRIGELSVLLDEMLS